MKTVITLIEFIAASIAWSLFAALLAAGVQWLWNAMMPMIGFARLDMFPAFLGSLIFITLWMYFITPLKYRAAEEKQ